MLTRNLLFSSIALTFTLLLNISPLRGQEKLVVGLADTVFAGQSKEKIVAQIKPFSAIVEKETGTPAEFKVVDLATLDKEFASGKIPLVFVTGLEYGWLKAAGQKITPLIIVDNDPGATATTLLVPQTSSVTKWEELEGKKVATDKFPFLSQYFLKATMKKEAGSFFKLEAKANADDAIESVLDKESEGVIVTGLGWNTFQERKPGRAKRLKPILTSPEFPAAAFVAHGNTDKGIVKKFEQAMLNAAKDTEGKQVLTLYKLKGFKPLPADYEKQVEEIVKKYPR